jgi:signal transduction histidine kinase
MKRPRGRIGLRARLTLSFVLVIVVTMGTMVVLANVITTSRINRMASEWGRSLASRLAPQFAQYYARHASWEGVQEELGGSQRYVASPALLDPEPRVVVFPGADTGDRPRVRPERLLLYDAGGELVADSASWDPAPVLSARQRALSGVPIMSDGQQVGTLVLASGIGRLSPLQREQVQQITLLLLLAGLIATAAVVMVGELQTQAILRPVHALVRAAHLLAGGDLSQRVAAYTGDELGEMAEAFNTMAAKLEEQSGLRHRVMADIAHELRTPLSVLQIELESLEDGLIVADTQVVAGLQEEVAHLGRLVEDLRVLSLADAGELAMEREPVDVGWLVDSTTRRVQEAARNRQVTLKTQVAAGLPSVMGDAQRLAQVLLNLLANALEHTPANGQITVGARSLGGQIEIWVQDDGEGICAADLPRIFERLYRADRSRSRSTGGSGLGLSIAKSLIAAHGGAIWAESVEGQGTIITFSLPVVDPAEEEAQR